MNEHLAETASERLVRLMAARGVAYMTEQEAALADRRADRQDARAQREHEAQYRFRPKPVRQGMPSERGARSFKVTQFHNRPMVCVAPQTDLGVSWGATEADSGPCADGHVADAVAICPLLRGLDVATLQQHEVTPYELAEGLRSLRERPPGIVRTTHVAYLIGIIRRERKR